MDSMTDRSRSSFNAWYGRNAESYNAERKRRYHQDPEAREKARRAAALYREKVAQGERTPERRRGLFTSALVAKLLGISTQTLRNWESREVIPKPTVPGKHRLYTELQLQLLKGFVSSLSKDRIEQEISRGNLFLGWADAGDQEIN